MAKGKSVELFKHHIVTDSAVDENSIKKTLMSKMSFSMPKNAGEYFAGHQHLKKLKEFFKGSVVKK